MAEAKKTTKTSTEAAVKKTAAKTTTKKTTTTRTRKAAAVKETISIQFAGRSPRTCGNSTSRRIPLSSRKSSCSSSLKRQRHTM